LTCTLRCLSFLPVRVKLLSLVFSSLFLGLNMDSCRDFFQPRSARVRFSALRGAFFFPHPFLPASLLKTTKPPPQKQTAFTPPLTNFFFLPRSTYLSTLACSPSFRSGLSRVSYLATFFLVERSFFSPPYKVRQFIPGLFDTSFFPLPGPLQTCDFCA